MADTEAGLPEIYVQPGESHLVHEPSLLRTVLGSCVGITFRAGRLGVGALCHPMLPRLPAGHLATIRGAAGCRYVDYAIRDLVRQFTALGVQPGETEVKLFGGADVLLSPVPATRPTVGAMNAETALRVLREEGFEVMASSLGGTRGIRIQFHTGTGVVLLRRLC